MTIISNKAADISLPGIVRRKRMKKNRFNAWVFIIALLIFWGVPVLCIRGSQMQEFAYQSTAILPEEIHEVKDYEIADRHFTPLSIDPKIFFYADNYENVCGVRITFERGSVPEKIQVYYAGEKGAFTEENSAFSLVKGRTAVDVIFRDADLGRIADISVDINEAFTLKNIEILSNPVMVAENHTKEYVICFAVAVVLAAGMAFLPVMDRVADWLKSKIEKLIRNKKRIGLYAAALISWAAVSFLIAYLVKLVCHYEYFNRYEAVVIFTGGAIVISAYALRNVTATKPQYLFFVVAIFLGSLNILTSPKTTGISWDDETHYGRTVYFSYGANHEIPYSDNEIVYHYVTVVEDFQYHYSREGRESWLSLVDGYKAEDYFIDTEDYTLSTAYVANISPAIGLIIGRGLGCSYSTTYMLGRFMNLLQYAVIFFAAISLIKGRGKYILSAFGLIPTCVFLASSYSYDGWVIAISALAYAMFIAELQKEESCITLKKWIGILAVFALGVLPKAIYFPMIFPMIFIGKKKFDNRHKFHTYVWVNIAVMLLLILSFVIPVFTRGAGLDDTRVFSDVDSVKQIEYIIMHPLQYTVVLLKFIVQYLSPDKSLNYLTYLGYYGYASNYVAIFVSIGFVALMENDGKQKGQTALFKLVLSAAFFATVCLMATALYVSFTPVGSDKIEGCQWRYLLPVLFPVIYWLSEFKIDTDKINKGLYASVVLVVIGLIFVTGIGNLCVRYY